MLENTLPSEDEDLVRETKLALLLVDLTGYTRAAEQLDAVELARVLDGYYRVCEELVAAHGGRVVKYMGDACLATFGDDAVVQAVDCAVALERRLRAAPLPWRPKLGANIHLSVVAAGELGACPPRYDIVGAGVNHLFLMGNGPGIRLSEPVYRRLPNERRGEFQKRKPPATYTLRD